MSEKKEKKVEIFTPTIFYRCPGKHSRPRGTYDWAAVPTEKMAEDLKNDGWFESFEGAVNAFNEGKKK